MMDSRSTLATGGASSSKARPPALPLWGRTSGSGSGSDGADSPPGRHSPLLDERPPPPSPPSHEPLRPVRRAWGGGPVPLVGGSPLPDVGGFSYSTFPATLAASLTTSAGPEQPSHDTTATAGSHDGSAAAADDEAEAVGWISVEKQAHAHGAIAPLPLSPRPLETQPEDEAEETYYSPRRSLPTAPEGQGDETPAAEVEVEAAASAGDGMAQTSITGAYDIAISAPFDFPRDDTQGYSPFSPSTASRAQPTKQTRAEQDHATALWSKVALLPAGLLSHSVERLGNRSDTLYFGQGKPTTESAGAFPELPHQFEGSVRPSARPRPPGRSSRPRLSVTTLGDYVPSPEQQLFWQSHESAVVLAQACVRRRRAMQDYPNHRRRHRIALELWTTEQTYIKALQQCTQMRKKLESLPKPILTPLEIKTIFSETETILLYATELESKLRQQLEHWHVDQTLAHVFTEIQPFFKVYNRYMIQYNASQTTYKHALQSSSFQLFLQSCAEHFVHTDLPSILIMPVQRIPRYILLLDALVSHTPTTHTDYADLCKALDVMKRFTESANQTQRNYERYQAILRLHELIQPQIPNLVVPSRVFQGAGSLLLIDGSRVMRRNQRKVRQVFLFNDLMLVTKHIRSENKYHLKVLVFLSSVQLDHNPPVPGEDGERCFLLRSRQRPAQSLLLEARSTEDKMAWVIALERATYLLAQPRTAPSPP